MYSNKMMPRVTKNSFRFTHSCENGASKTLIGVTYTHAFISHNFGITWKQINDVSGTNLTVSYCVSDLIVISDGGTGNVYFLDGRGNLTKEFVFKPGWVTVSVHPNDSNAILLHNFEYDEKYPSAGIQTTYYTKDGGASEWKVLCKDDSMGIELYNEVPFYKFITGGARDLIYIYEEGYWAYTGYALNFFSESPVEFKLFPFFVHRAQNIFYAIKCQKELHVSTDGVNFEQVELYHSSPWDHANRIYEAIQACECIMLDGDDRHYCNWAFNDRRAKGFLFFQKRYSINRGSGGGFGSPALPWVTLFRYDVKCKEVKTMLEYCYDYMVVSAEEGIIIANYVTNPQECVENEEKPIVRTMITFNDGTDWEPITGPSGAELNVAISASLYCCRGSIPSNSSMMIVWGKEGPIENYQEAYSDSSSLSTYMTKDSGRSWRKINDDAMNYMIGDSDNIIIMFREGQEYILYSLDGGMNWQKRTIGKVDLRCWDSSSSSNSKRFLLGDCTISFDPTDQLEQSYL